MDVRGELLLLLLLGVVLIDIGLGDSFSDDTLCCKAYDNLIRNYVINADCGGGSTTAAPSTAAPTTTTAAPTTTTAAPTTTTAATTPFNPCASAPCQHSGTCVPNGSNYTCICPALFTGDNCQIFYCDLLLQKGGGNVAINITKLNDHLGYCANEGSTTYFVFQRRVDGSVSFNKNWADYENGFGLPYTGNNYYFGNKYLAELLSYTQWILHIDLTDKSGTESYADYDNFHVAGASTNYQLTSLGAYSGTAVDGMSYHLWSQFSTPDADHDNCTCNCAQAWQGGWWFNDCHRGYLNGVYGSSVSSMGINWVPTDTPSGSPSYTYSFSKASMMIRPVV